MKRHRCPSCPEPCLTCHAVRPVQAGAPPTYHPHDCPHHRLQVGAFCRECELVLEPPVDDGPVDPKHGVVHCDGCGDMLLACPLGVAMADDALNEQARHPASLAAS